MGRKIEAAHHAVQTLLTSGGQQKDNCTTGRPTYLDRLHGSWNEKLVDTPRNVPKASKSQARTDGDAVAGGGIGMNKVDLAKSRR